MPPYQRLRMEKKRVASVTIRSGWKREASVAMRRKWQMTTTGVWKLRLQMQLLQEDERLRPEKRGFSRSDKKMKTTGAWKWRLQMQLLEWTKVIIIIIITERDKIPHLPEEERLRPEKWYFSHYDKKNNDNNWSLKVATPEATTGVNKKFLFTPVVSSGVATFMLIMTNRKWVNAKGDWDWRSKEKSGFRDWEGN